MPDQVSIDKGAFRIRDWWWSKAALLMGMVYLYTVWFGITFERFLPLALLSLCTIAGFASFGYLMNDLFDMRQDMLAGKRNFLVSKGPLLIVLIFLISLAFIFLPWLYLPAERFSYLLIGFQLLLFLIYSAPPLRLKERGLAGIITDSLYAHAVPPILAAYTFALAAGKPVPGAELLLLFSWQFACGVRNILMHQYEDKASDQKSGSRTFLVSLSDTGFSFSVRYLIITELLFSLGFFGLLSLSQPLFALIMLIIMIISAVVLRLFFFRGIDAMLTSPWRYFPNNLYEKWLPLSFLLLAIFSDGLFLIILLVHLILFNLNLYQQILKRIRLGISWTEHHLYTPTKLLLKAWASLLVNYFIYYALLLFGIDLKKENTSALNYFRKKYGKKQS